MLLSLQLALYMVGHMGDMMPELNNYCPECYQNIQYGIQKCPYCGCPINWGIPPQEIVQPPVHISQQQAAASKRTGGGIICVHCGNSIIPVKSNFGCVFLICSASFT